MKVSRQGLRRSDGTWLMCFPGELMTKRWGAGFVLVHRAELQQLLAAELDPSAIHLGARCTGVEDGNRAVTARFADGREVQADVMVGADGVHSAVRAALFGPAALRYRGYATVRGITPRDRFRFPSTVPRPGAGAHASAWAHQRRTDHLVGDMERDGGREGRRRHRGAVARTLRRLARSDTRHHRRHPGDRCDPEGDSGPLADPDVEPGTGSAARRCHPPDDAGPRPGRRSGDRRRNRPGHLPRGRPTAGRLCGSTSGAGGATPPSIR